MNADRYEHVKRVFLEACELEPERAAAYLDEACAGDPALREEVESLLAHHVSETIVDRRTGSPAQQPERFAPGVVLAGRYRIMGPLGRGGMGDVYRADDLKLDQPVALKFLSQLRAKDPLWLYRYGAEVRLARKVTHPNVVRVYDLVESDGEVFISMEYVDGEDLGGLLRRVGPLTSSKVVQIARQLCGGLGAAHDQGVLHRDLKPANILIDSRGQARIADFGIAELAARAENCPLAGTPEYMAPELFAGTAPSVRSDLFALGAVLYELSAGKGPFGGRPVGQWDWNTAIQRPFPAANDAERALESVILQCLERDPQRRPASAYMVAAPLLGGDPLAMALAAGETPSPSMIAAAGAGMGLRPRAAAVCLGVALVALTLIVRLAERTLFLSQTGLLKAPPVLLDKAEEILQQLGYDDAGRPTSQGFVLGDGGLKPGPPGRAVYFWRHVGRNAFSMPAFLGEATAGQPWRGETGAVDVRLDGRGRLVEFVAAPETALTPGPRPPINWAPLFELAGLILEKFVATRPIRGPPTYADQLLAWEGADPSDPQTPVRVEAASLSGRIVHFAVLPTWWQPTGPGRSPGAEQALSARTPSVRWALQLTAILLGGALAWRNVRRGRVDHVGAGRLAAFVFLLGLIDWWLGERHAANFAEEIAALYLWVARAVFTAAVAWACYVAVEPYVRRFWPQALVAWSMLLRGRFRDPRVGRDLLVGGMCGLLLVLALQADVLLPGWLGLPAGTPKLPGPIYDLTALLSLRYRLGILVTILLGDVTLGLIILLLMLLVRIAVRPPWLARCVAWAALTGLLVLTAGDNLTFPWLTSAALMLLLMVLFLRAGLVAGIAALVFSSLLLTSPLTCDLRAWYAPLSTFTLSLAVLLLVYGFSIARAGAPWISRLPPHAAS